MRSVIVCSSLALALAPGLACGGGGGGDPDPDGGLPVDARTFTSIFDPDRLLEIELTLAPADWQTIRHQNRSFVDILTGDCQAGPYASPFTYVPAAITVDGTTVPQVAVRKKGFMGSLSWERPSLRVDVDRLVPGQRVLGRDDLVLNNAIQDA